MKLEIILGCSLINPIRADLEINRQLRAIKMQIIKTKIRRFFVQLHSSSLISLLATSYRMREICPFFASQKFKITKLRIQGKHLVLNLLFAKTLH